MQVNPVRDDKADLIESILENKEAFRFHSRTLFSHFVQK